MKKQIVFICVLVAFALVFMAGCGDDSSDEATKETKAKAKAAQMPTKATKETKAEAEKKDEKDKKKEYTGVVQDRIYEKFVLGTDNGSVEFTTSDDTEFYFGDNKYMFVGDVVRVEYDDAGGVKLAKRIDLLEEPEPGFILGDYAANMCWPHDQNSKGKYGSGRPNDAYGNLYDRLQPQAESGISSPQWRAGASCDLFVATALRGFGLTDFPVTLSNQCGYFFGSDDYKEAFEKIDTGGDISKMKHGDVGIYIRAGSTNNGQGHIFIVDKAGGHNWKSNAHYRKGPGYFGVIDDLKGHYDPGHYKYFGVFRLK